MKKKTKTLVLLMLCTMLLCLAGCQTEAAGQTQPPKDKVTQNDNESKENSNSQTENSGQKHADGTAPAEGRQKPTDGNAPPEGRQRPTDGNAPADGGQRPKDGQRPEGANGAQGTRTKASVSVEAEPIVLDSISSELRTLGIVNPGNEAVFGTTVSGTVDAIYVSVGDVVTKGDPIYSLNDDDTIESNNQAKTKAFNALETAQLEYNSELDDFSNTKILYDSGAVSKEDYDTAENDLKSAKLKLESEQINYNNAVKNASISMEDMVLTAPADGMISSIDVSVGEKSTNADITLINLDTLKVESLVAGNIISELSIGDSVRVQYGDTSLDGTLTKIDPVGKNGTDSYGVDVTLVDAGTLLQPGYRVDLYFSVNQLTDQIVVNKRSVLTDAYGDYLFTLQDNKAVKTYIEQGITNNGRVQIIGDIAEGTVYVTSGQNVIQEGDMVSVVNQ